MADEGGPRGVQFAELIRAARHRMDISQDELALQSGTSRTTINRWESGRAERPDPDQVRAACRVLGVDPRQAAVALGYLSPHEVENEPARFRRNPEAEEVLEMLEDPGVPQEQKRQWIDYLRYLRDRHRAD